MKAARPDTWMPLYWGDYLRDTLHLSAAEHGAYLLLIGHYWTTGSPLPDDNKRLSRIARMDAREWRAARPILEPFFVIEDGLWRHGRVDAELAQAFDNMEKRRAQTAAATEARKKRDAIRYDKRDEDRNVKRNDPPTRARVSPSPSPSPSPDGSDPNGSGGNAAGQDELSLVVDNGITPAQFEEMAVSEKALFRYGKAVFGGSGGQVKKVCKLYPGDQRAAADLIRQASQKADPNEWLGAVLRGDDRAETPEHILYPPGVYDNVR